MMELLQAEAAAGAEPRAGVGWMGVRQRAGPVPVEDRGKGRKQQELGQAEAGPDRGMETSF